MLRKFLSGWFRKKDGTTAIEFSFMLVPYILLSVAIIELSMMYAAASLLEGATGDAARLIRTGQLQDGADPEDRFREALCDYATVLINCNEVIVDVRHLESFSDYSQPQYDEDGNMIPGQFDAGGSNDRVLIRVAYRYTMMTPFIGPLLAGPSNTRLFVSTILLQTEPYDFEGS